ncbi:YggS family pyridoxal phosphate-dependent enzyme [candidate division GN15 bacterium]|uniref:Pyridoxal phosphate homeostasis protein n=1 Tax=candidate division GN15 bacterium TaxID=2072418 RepID=A0A855X306_9BACT|nr:MAG: YggS family pyridoxal phosphate-dependent enzyme [candidate division GN15 bacterium]
MSQSPAITEHLVQLKLELARICADCGRDPASVTILAVTKTHPAEILRQAVAAGLTDIGENRVQEAEGKFAQTGHIARFHLIGHLQSNKAKKAVRLFDVIQSVDSPGIALEISRRAGEVGKTIECLIEVNSSGEPQKFGVLPPEVIALAGEIGRLPNIKLTGLMTVGPLTDDPSQIRAAFRQCRELFEQMKAEISRDIAVLSMGMSGDYPIAVEEGSTMIRIGTLLFGERE